MKPSNGVTCLALIGTSLCLAWWPLSNPAQSLTNLPATATITVHARTSDGKAPTDVSCTIQASLPQRFFGNPPPPLPLIGSNGDWLATNVPAVYYDIHIRGSNYAEQSENTMLLVRVEPGSNYVFSIPLSRGATFKGRVLDADSGQPIAHATIYGYSNTQSRGRQSAEDGTFAIPHMVGELRVTAQGSNFVGQELSVSAAKEDESVILPDFKMVRGGWISGKVDRPVDAPTNSYCTITPRFSGAPPSNALLQEVSAREEGSFLVGPLPGGTYTLAANWQASIFKGGTPDPWRAEAWTGQIQVEAGKETKGISIEMKSTPASDR